MYSNWLIKAIESCDELRDGIEKLLDFMKY